MTAVYKLGVAQLDSLGWSAFDSRFTKFVLGTSGGIKFVILVEDSDTGGLNSINPRPRCFPKLSSQHQNCEANNGIEYLLCNSDVVNLVWESNEVEAESIIVNFCYLGVL